MQATLHRTEAGARGGLHAAERPAGDAVKRFAILWQPMRRSMNGLRISMRADEKVRVWAVAAESETAALLIAHRVIPKNWRPLEAKEETCSK
jgi:hypothetical protein